MRCLRAGRQAFKLNSERDSTRPSTGTGCDASKLDSEPSTRAGRDVSKLDSETNTKPQYTRAGRDASKLDSEPDTPCRRQSELAAMPLAGFRAGQDAALYLS